MAVRIPLVSGTTTNYPTELPAGDTIQPIVDHVAEANPHTQYFLIASAYIDGGNYTDTYLGSPFATDGGSF